MLKERPSLVHFMAPYFSTACDKDTRTWQDRAFRVTNNIREVTCRQCLYKTTCRAVDRMVELRDTRQNLEMQSYFTRQVTDLLEESE